VAKFYKPKAKKATSFAPVTVDITDLSHDGRGIARHNGKTVFVDGALPGEVVVAKIEQSHQRYSHASVAQWISTSKQRVHPPCTHFAQCGGCRLQYMDHATQIDYKIRALQQQLARLNVRPLALLPPLTGSPYQYRQRVRLSVNHRGAQPVVGFRKHHSRQLVAIDQCPIMLPSLEGVLSALKQWVTRDQKGAVTHIELIGACATTGVLVRHTRPIPLGERAILQQQLGTTCAVWFQASKAAALEDADGEVVDPRLGYTLDDFGLTLQFHPQDFIQSNAEVNPQMVAQAVALMSPQPHEHMVDFFCGVGNFTLPLASRAARVTAIEGDTEMVERAKANAAANRIDNIDFIAGDLSVDNPAVAALGKIDGMLLDPPRAGAFIICQQIMKLKPERIVYVSCDPATFARDAQCLQQHHYQLASLGIMDMFPQTAHTEVMGLFTRKS